MEPITGVTFTMTLIQLIGAAGASGISLYKVYSNHRELKEYKNHFPHFFRIMLLTNIYSISVAEINLLQKLMNFTVKRISAKPSSSFIPLKIDGGSYKTSEDLRPNDVITTIEDNVDKDAAVVISGVHGVGKSDFATKIAKTWLEENGNEK